MKRTVTFKSKVGDLDNAFSNNTIQELFDISPVRLIKMYYTIERLDLHDEIKQAIKLKYKQFEEINKPGIDRNKFKSFFGFSYETKTYAELKKLVIAKRINNQPLSKSLVECYNKKKNQLYLESTKSNELSKSLLQNINHGHK
jgi:hypothetical protein